MTVPRELWTQLQRAETLLVHATAACVPERRAALMDGFDAPRDVLHLLHRVGSGFPRDEIRPEDYLARYPFSDLQLIRAEFARLASHGLLVRLGDTFQLTAKGGGAIEVWMERVAGLISAVPIDGITQEETRLLIACDEEIVESVRAAERSHGWPIFFHRLRGIRAETSPPALWQHWQLVWTVLAASEDEEESVRRERGMDPLEWFLRRQLWFVDRRPWRVRARSIEGLAARAAGYAPLWDAKGACAEGIERMRKEGVVAEDESGLRLSERGLEACDQDEQEIDANLLSAWPAWSPRRIEQLEGIVARINLECARLIETHARGEQR